MSPPVRAAKSWEPRDSSRLESSPELGLIPLGLEAPSGSCTTPVGVMWISVGKWGGAGSQISQIGGGLLECWNLEGGNPRLSYKHLN